MMKQFFLDTPYGHIHYLLAGAGEPVILLHQSPRSTDEYAEVIPLLAKKHQVIAMDTLGYGASDKPAQQPTLDDFAKTVIMLMDHLNFTKASFVGHHTGAKIAELLAIDYPERVDKLVLSNPGLLDDERMKRAAEEFFARLWAVKEDGSHYQEIWQFWKEHDPLLPPHVLNRIVLDHVRAGGGEGKTGPYGFIAVFRSNVDSRLGEIKAPALILWGTHDLSSFGFPRENEEKVNKAIRRSKTISIEGGTFALPHMMPEKFAHLILEFLANPGV